MQRNKPSDIFPDTYLEQGTNLFENLSKNFFKEAGDLILNNPLINLANCIADYILSILNEEYIGVNIVNPNELLLIFHNRPKLMEYIFNLVKKVNATLKEYRKGEDYIINISTWRDIEIDYVEFIRFTVKFSKNIDPNEKMKIFQELSKLATRTLPPDIRAELIISVE